jgi:hypothetical protein
MYKNLIHFLFIVFLFISFSCNKDECVIITNKLLLEEEFYFYFDTDYKRTGSSNSDPSNFSPIGSGKVSKDVYEKYSVGDEYCY